MKPEQINIAIAEACGWTNMFTFNDTGKPFTVGYPPDAQGRAEYISSQCSPQIPNYVGSLDAMHDAWHTFGYDQRNTFEYELDRIVNAPFLANETVTVCPPTNATAAQRAEAFLKTLNLWIEPTEPAPATK